MDCCACTCKSYVSSPSAPLHSHHTLYRLPLYNFDPFHGQHPQHHVHPPYPPTIAHSIHRVGLACWVYVSTCCHQQHPCSPFIAMTGVYTHAWRSKAARSCTPPALLPQWPITTGTPVAPGLQCVDPAVEVSPSWQTTQAVLPGPSA